VAETGAIEKYSLPLLHSMKVRGGFAAFQAVAEYEEPANIRCIRIRPFFYEFLAFKEKHPYPLRALLET
jgi:hypothetical protein